MADVIFRDDFSGNGPIDESVWRFNKYDAGGFYGNTLARQSLPSASDGYMHLLFSLFNPTWREGGPNAIPTFLGSEAITQRLFDVAKDGPIAFEASLRYVQNQPGIIGGFFTYGFPQGDPDKHDEIDFEAMSNFYDQIQTNIYHNEPGGDGHWESKPLPSGTLGDFHTYRIEWRADSVKWFVDGVFNREVTAKELVPDQPMSLHLNIWSGFPSWRTSSDQTQPVPTAQGDKTYTLDVDWVQVEKISNVKGSDASETLMGTAENDFIEGFGGNDSIYGGEGHDTASFLSAPSNAHTLIAGQDFVAVTDRLGGLDFLSGIESIRFSDQAIDTTTLGKATLASDNDFAALTDLYAASLDRAPDAMGLAYWASRMVDGMSLQEIAKSFFAQAETQLEFANAKTATAFVTQAYQNVLERAPDAQGLEYWVNELESGHVGKDDFLLSFIGGARAQSGSLLDAQTLANKTAVGLDFAVREGLNDVAWARAVMDKADGSPGGMAAALQLIDEYAEAAAATGTSQLVLQLVGVSLEGMPLTET